jgi:hypothetical protein
MRSTAIVEVVQLVSLLKSPETISTRTFGLQDLWSVET